MRALKCNPTFVHYKTAKVPFVRDKLVRKLVGRDFQDNPTCARNINNLSKTWQTTCFASKEESLSLKLMKAQADG